MTEHPPAAHPWDQIAIGDQLARSGDWRRAIATWQDAAACNSACLKPVERRLTWFLKQTRSSPTPLLENGSLRLVIAAMASGLLATALVLAAGEPGSAVSNLLAALAWALYLAAATLTVIAARGPQQPELDMLLRRAHAAADRLEPSIKDSTA